MTTAESLKILEITGTPTKAAIKKAFRKAALQHHPDARGTNQRFIAIKTAYDTLMSLSSEELAHHQLARATPNTGGQYDPFADPDYDKRTFFMPENPATEGYERKLRAKSCPHCKGYGVITKNINPSKGFLGRERRLCKCQWA